MSYMVYGHCSFHFYKFPKTLHIKFGFDWPSGLKEKISLKIMVIYMYIAPGQGQTILGLKIKNINLLLICCKFFSFNNAQTTKFDLVVGDGQPRVTIYTNFVEL